MSDRVDDVDVLVVFDRVGDGGGDGVACSMLFFGCRLLVIFRIETIIISNNTTIAPIIPKKIPTISPSLRIGLWKGFIPPTITDGFTMVGGVGGGVVGSSTDMLAVNGFTMVGGVGGGVVGSSTDMLAVNGFTMVGGVGGGVGGSSTDMLAVTAKQTSYIAVLCTLLILFGLADGLSISYAERS